MNMTPVKGRRKNLQSVGWENHVLQVVFAGGRSYQFGGVPEDVKDKLLRVPFPDKLFTQLVKGKYVSRRIDALPPSKPVPPSTCDLDNLPF